MKLAQREGVSIGSSLGGFHVSEANLRLAGILAADVVGYSAMIGKDEPATLARVRTLRTNLVEPLAAGHGGRLFKTTGDGFLAAFASAVQALRCAIAIQERLNSEPDGASACDLRGDGVIIAARLKPLTATKGWSPCHMPSYAVASTPYKARVARYINEGKQLWRRHPSSGSAT